MTAPLIVCGWFTPDYRHWADKLIASLDAVGAPHDIVEVPKLPGTWEANTMAKSAQLLAAMDRHPDKCIAFLDVDCRVLGDLSPLAGIGGGVGFYMRTKWRRSGGMRFGARSGESAGAGTQGRLDQGRDGSRESDRDNHDQDLLVRYERSRYAKPPKHDHRPMRKVDGIGETPDRHQGPGCQHGRD